MSVEILYALSSAFNKATFLLENKSIAKSEYIKKNVEIMLKLLTDSNRERGFIFHQGTCLPLYLATIMACFKSFLSDDSDKLAFVDGLTVGDLVIYRNKRGEFKGRDKEGRIVIENFDRGILTVNRVPLSLANTISPYNGNAKTLDGRGVKNKVKTNKFISTLFNIKPEDIKSTITKSVVVVCEKSEADSFMKRLSIRVNDKNIKISELFPSAYYTSNDVYYYSGNSAKVEPLLKFTNKLFVARELIIDDRGIETLVIDGSKYFLDDFSELASIYNRSSLKSIILLEELFKGIESSAFSSFENLKSFLWTKETLNEIAFDQQRMDNEVCEESRILHKMIKNFINCEIKIHEVEGTLNHHILLECKKTLHHLIKHNSSHEKINTFIIKGFWLLNLMERSFFPLSTMEQLILEGKINALSPAKELDNMQNIANEFMGSTLEGKLFEMVSMLRLIKNEMEHVNPKFDYLMNLFNQAKYIKKRMAVVGAKAYYQKIFLESAPVYLKETIEKCDFYTPNNFSSINLFQDVIIVGITDWAKLNPLLLSNTKALTFLVYRNERIRLIQAEARTKQRLLLLRNNSQIDGQERLMSEIQIANLTVPTASNEELDEITIEDELETITRQFSLNYAVTEMREVGMGGLQTSEVKRVAILETGEKVFFTKYYTPYVFDVDRKSVVETDVSSLKPGDLLIFTNYDNDTRDIVERIMDMMLDSNNYDERFRESRRKSLYWKMILKEYMHKNKLSYKDLSNKMNRMGKGKHEVTLRTWLDEGSHIVGPRDSESFYLIAKITNDATMLKDPEAFYNSCREVRSIRIRILKYIAKNILQTYNKVSELSEDEMLSKLQIDISKMSRIVQIDKIIDVDNINIPSHSVNRPQNL